MLELKTAAGNEPPIELGQVDLGLSDGDTEPLLLLLTNRNGYDLSEVRVGVEGRGAGAVQLAREEEGVPGSWSGEIIARAGLLPPNNTCRFFVRAVPDDSLKLGQQRFEFVVKSVAVVS